MADSDSTPDFDSMSDEDFLNAGFPSPGSVPADPEDKDDDLSGGVLEDRLKGPSGSEEDGSEGGEDPDDPDDPDDKDDAEPESEKDVVPEQKAKAGSKEDGPKPADDGDKAAAADAPEAEVDKAGDDKTVDHTTPKQSEATGSQGPKTAEEFEAAYKKLMAPFKANGRELTPSSPDEAVRLMQMGANYTKKMQALKPNLRLMRMLENQGLLEESKLSYLIDLDRKDPKAIQKLLHGSNVDPLDIDVASEPTYEPGNHAPSEQEMNFHDAVDTVAQTPTGKETISHINSSWDQTSKKAIYQEPDLLRIIDEQRANGIYRQIADEIDRRRVFGELTATPFIQAYKQIGDELHAQGKLTPTGTSMGTSRGTPVQAQPQVVDTRSRQRSKPVANGDKVGAMSPGPKVANNSSTPREFDPFTMTDEQIMAMTSLKV